MTYKEFEEYKKIYEQKKLYEYDDGTGFFNALDQDYQDWLASSATTPYVKGETKQLDLTCIHDAVEYVGLTDSFQYCKKCDVKLWLKGWFSWFAYKDRDAKKLAMLITNRIWRCKNLLLK